MSKEIKKGEFNETPFGIIGQSEILTAQDFKDIETLKPELKETFLKVQIFRTRTEMEVSVLGDLKHPTPASKYWQSVREQNVMFNELVMLSYEYRKNQIEIQILERDIKSGLEGELTKIEIEKKQFIARNQERTAKDRIREIKAWSQIKTREAALMTPEELENVNTHQLTSYHKAWLKEAEVMGEGGSPSERRNLLNKLQTAEKYLT